MSMKCNIVQRKKFTDSSARKATPVTDQTTEKFHEQKIIVNKEYRSFFLQKDQNVILKHNKTQQSVHYIVIATTLNQLCFYGISSCSSLDTTPVFFRAADMFFQLQQARLSIIAVIRTWIPNSTLNILHVPRVSRGNALKHCAICIIYFSNTFTLCLHNQG